MLRLDGDHLRKDTHADPAERDLRIFLRRRLNRRCQNKSSKIEKFDIKTLLPPGKWFKTYKPRAYKLLLFALKVGEERVLETFEARVPSAKRIGVIPRFLLDKRLLLNVGLADHCSKILLRISKRYKKYIDRKRPFLLSGPRGTVARDRNRHNVIVSEELTYQIGYLTKFPALRTRPLVITGSALRTLWVRHGLSSRPNWFPTGED